MAEREELHEYAAKPPAEAPPPLPSFPIVAVGASAGGLRAFGQFFKHVPETSGMAFVVVQHVVQHRGPAHESRLAELLRYLHVRARLRDGRRRRRDAWPQARQGTRHPGDGAGA